MAVVSNQSPFTERLSLSSHTSLLHSQEFLQDIDCKDYKLFYLFPSMLSPNTHPPTDGAVSLVLLTHRVRSGQDDTMTPVTQNHIHSNIPTPFRIISFMI